MTTQTMTTKTTLETDLATKVRKSEERSPLISARRLTPESLRRFVEEGDWDEILLEKQPRFDSACLGILILATAFLAPLFIQFFQG